MPLLFSDFSARRLLLLLSRSLSRSLLLRSLSLSLSLSLCLETPSPNFLSLSLSRDSPVSLSLSNHTNDFGAKKQKENKKRKREESRKQSLSLFVSMVDVVIWGATGFTGRLIARHFAQNVSPRLPQLKWAIAGRSRDKLQELHSSLQLQQQQQQPQQEQQRTASDKVEVLVADPHDPQQMDHLAASAQVVIAAAGPFSEIGTGLVDACVRNECDYVDITGEVPWVRSIADRFHTAAIDQKRLIVPMCGFDSVPSDMSTFAAVSKLWRDHRQHAVRARTYVAMRGTVSGGTIRTGLLLKQQYATEYNDPYLLCHASGSQRTFPAGGADVDAWDIDLEEAEFDSWALGNGTRAEREESERGIWTAPFTMAKINTRVVRRSNVLFGEGCDGPAGASYDGWTANNSSSSPLGSPFTYGERCVAKSQQIAEKMAANEAIPPDTIARLVDRKRLPRPGMGPGPDQREAAWFQFTTIAESATGERAAVRMVRIFLQGRIALCGFSICVYTCEFLPTVSIGNAQNCLKLLAYSHPCDFNG